MVRVITNNIEIITVVLHVRIYCQIIIVENEKLRAKFYSVNRY